METPKNCQEFQNKVSQLLLRHKSVLDGLTKFQESNARVNRAIVKSITNCGCLQVNADKQTIPEKASIEEYDEHLSTHLEGQICSDCKEVLINEIGNHLFYLAALSNTLDIDMDKALSKEADKISTLGFFNLT